MRIICNWARTEMVSQAPRHVTIESGVPPEELPVGVPRRRSPGGRSQTQSKLQPGLSWASCLTLTSQLALSTLNISTWIRGPDPWVAVGGWRPEDKGNSLTNQKSLRMPLNNRAVTLAGVEGWHESGKEIRRVLRILIFRHPLSCVT